MTKTKLSATDSTGQTHTRTTARDYKFVVVSRITQAFADRHHGRVDAAVEAGDTGSLRWLRDFAEKMQACADANEVCDASWSSRLDLAEKVAAKAREKGYAVEIISVG